MGSIADNCPICVLTVSARVLGFSLWKQKVNRANVNQQAFSEGYLMDCISTNFLALCIGIMNRKSSKLFLLLGEVKKGLPFDHLWYSNDPSSLC